MDYDIAIIGAGMSGLAAGIRLAHFGKKVCIFEQHNRIGGLNSFYTRNGHELDVGLHALTNFSSAGERRAPLNKLLRQLRIRRDELELCPQLESEIEFPEAVLRFTNDFTVLRESVRGAFPDQLGRFDRLVQAIEQCDAYALREDKSSAKALLQHHLSDPQLIEMLMCPVLFYGGAAAGDMPVQQYAVLFRSIFFEGLGRPRQGIRKILDRLKSRYHECGGEMRLACGVKRITAGGGDVARLVLTDGSQVEVGSVLSAAGYLETLKLCEPAPPELRSAQPGRLSFVETILQLDRPARDLGLTSTTSFVNETQSFRYEPPSGLVDSNSAVLCVPGNFSGCENTKEACQVRITRLASPARWLRLSDDQYGQSKAALLQDQINYLEKRAPGIGRHILDHDLFTPRTVHRYTGHLNGAIYGSPVKHRDGRTPIPNVFVCGTDQGFLGIVGALMSGVSMANVHYLAGT